MRMLAWIVASLAFLAVTVAAAQPRDHIRYSDYSADPASMMLAVLADTAAHGLVGDHHYYFEFRTDDPGVELSGRLLEKYPEKMVIVLQHQFWDLAVDARFFSVTLSFDGVKERLRIPFAAVTWFSDPSMSFEIELP